MDAVHHVGRSIFAVWALVALVCGGCAGAKDHWEADRIVLEGPVAAAAFVAGEPTGPCKSAFDEAVQPMRGIRPAQSPSGVSQVLQAGNSSLITSITYADDGKHLITGADDGSLVVWDPASRLQLRSFYESSGIAAMAAIRDTQLILVATFDCRVSTWDITTGVRKQTLDGLTEHVQEVVVLRHDEQATVFAGSTQSGVSVWSVGAINKLLLRVPVDRVEGISASPNGKLIAVASHADAVQVMDIDSRTVRSFRIRPGHKRSTAVFVGDGVIRVMDGQGDVADIDISTQTRTVACHVDEKLDYEHGSNRTRPSGVWHLLPARSASVAVAFDWPNPGFVAWDLRTCKRSFRLDSGRVSHQHSRERVIALSPSGEQLLYPFDRDVMSAPLSGGASSRFVGGANQPVEFIRSTVSGSRIALEGSSRVTVLEWARGGLTVMPVERRWVQSLPRDTSVRTNGVAMVSAQGQDRLLALRSTYVAGSNRRERGRTNIQISSGSLVEGTSAALCAVSVPGELTSFLSSSDGAVLVLFVVDKDTENSWSVSLALLDPWRCKTTRTIDAGAVGVAFGGYLNDHDFATLSPDGALLTTAWKASYNPRANLLQASGKPCAPVPGSDLIANLRPEPKGASGVPLRSVHSMATSADGKYIIAGHANGDANIWNLSDIGGSCRLPLSVQATWTINGFDWEANAVAIDTATLTAAVGDESGTLRIYSLSSNRPVLSSSMRFDIPVRGVQIVDAMHLVAVTADGAASIVDLTGARASTSGDVLAGKHQVASFAATTDSSWVASTKDGRFDTNDIEGLAGLRWVVADEPMRALPLEIFSREYFEPGLLARMRNCRDDAAARSDPTACPKEFAPVRDIAQLNRLQPNVNTISVDAAVSDPGGPDTVSVKVAIDSTTNGTRWSGVHDVRLFVNGQLVRRIGAAGPLRDDPAGESEQQWRTRTRPPAPAGSNEAQVEFAGIQLPHRVGATGADIEVYAFNEDKVKSATLKRHVAFRPEAKPRRGKAYVIGFGVNEFKSGLHPLTYAATDATLLPARVSAALTSLSNQQGEPIYSEVMSLILVTDRASAGKPAVNEGRKDLIGALFEQLSGAPTQRVFRSADGRPLPRLLPEDLLVLVVSTHGDIAKDGTFFLATNDTQTDASGAIRADDAISSIDLARWFGDLSTGEFVLIIDACRSAGAVQDGTFKAGPLGNRGFGQFAYDKGMRVLAASQRNQYSAEVGALEDGLLTFALLDALKGGAIRLKPNGFVSLSEWLRVAEQSAPEIYRRAQAGKAIRGEAVVLKALDSASKTFKPFRSGEQPVELSQRPVLFDFYREPPRTTP